MKLWPQIGQPLLVDILTVVVARLADQQIKLNSPIVM